MGTDLASLIMWRPEVSKEYFALHLKYSRYGRRIRLGRPKNLFSDAVKTQKTRNDSEFTAIYMCKILLFPLNLTQALTFLARITEASGSNLGKFIGCPWAGIVTRYGMDGPRIEY